MLCRFWKRRSARAHKTTSKVRHLLAAVLLSIIAGISGSRWWLVVAAISVAALIDSYRFLHPLFLAGGAMNFPNW